MSVFVCVCVWFVCGCVCVCVCVLSRFEELYKHDPAALRKAKLFSQRVKEGDKYVTKQFTKVAFVLFVIGV